MVFSSLSFLFGFLPAVLAVYFVIPLKYRNAKNGVLLLFSLLFYSFGGWRLIPIILISIFINYTFGRLVSERLSRHNRILAICGAIICNLGLLICYKYIGFFTYNLHTVFPNIPVWNMLLPIGISFYTFQGLSYVIDVYRGQAKPESNILNVALYISLFPQLVAGPIVRYTTIADEILNRRETLKDFSEGATRFLFGLAKKVLLANQLGQIANSVFSQSTNELSTGLAWLGVLAYTVQIYFDFSGYSDMAIGLGKMFGFHFLENFNYPYIAKSITDFWRRWHISLSSWFRDYLYIPLGGNHGSQIEQVRNLFIVWTLTGFWHGAAWNFLLWGLYYAVLIVGERYLWGNLLQRIPNVFRHIYALFFIVVGWLIFRSSGLEQISSFICAMFGNTLAGAWNAQATYLLLEYRFELMIAVVASLPVKNVLRTALQTRQKNGGCWLLLNCAPPAIALLLGFLSVMRLISSSFNPFIYFQF